MSLQTNYSWMRSRGGEEALGRRRGGAPSGGRLVASRELGPWHVFNVFLAQMLFVTCIRGG